MINREPFNHYVVTTKWDVSQFGTLEIARKHRELNAPYAIWHGQDITEIQTDLDEIKFISSRMGARPIEIG